MATGLRGKLLKRLRERSLVGQRHLARQMGYTQPEISGFETERFGGLPRGFSARYQAALTEVIALAGTECSEGCGCKAAKVAANPRSMEVAA